MHHYFLNIGSNIGNRKLNISRALRALEAKYGYFETSKIMESKPWGFDSDNDFANVAVMIVTDKDPLEVLGNLHEIEAQYNDAPHRKSDGTYQDRILDIDIMAVDEIVIDCSELQIPHRHLPEREFFLQPMSELAPVWRHPVSGLTCSEMLEKLLISRDKQH